MIFIALMLITISCLIIWRVSDGFEIASSYLGRSLSDGVRGATINAVGSSMPELFTTFFFLIIFHDSEGFLGGLGTTSGSAVFNSIIIPAASIVTVLWMRKAKAIRITKKIILRDGIALLAAEIVLLCFLWNGQLHWYHGLMLIALYGIYLAYMLMTMQKKAKKAKHPEKVFRAEYSNSAPRGFKAWLVLDIEYVITRRKKMTLRRAWILLLSAMFIIGLASAILVKGCELIGSELQIPVYFIAVILASAATSVPDTILSIKDAQQGNYDDAVSNAFGSNIFDICFALGLPLFVYTVWYGPIVLATDTGANNQTIELQVLLIFITVAVLAIFLISKRLKIWQVFMLILLYIGFTGYIFGEATDAQWIEQMEQKFKSTVAKILD